MNKVFLDFILSISEDRYSEFIKNTDFGIEVDNNLEFTPLNHSWIDVVEQYVPFLKQAVDSPYQEIVDIVNSKNLYENRFLISLILRLDNFLNDKYNEISERLTHPHERAININGNTHLTDEDLLINISIKSKRCDDISNGAAYGLSAKERIERLIDVIKVITDSPFFKSLKDVKLVTSPIHRTNVILEDQNFKKLLELWIFLENYVLEQTQALNEVDVNKQLAILNHKAKNICFVNSQVFAGTLEHNMINEDYYKIFLEKIIEGLVSESTMDDKTFKKLINKKFEEAYIKKQNREKNIQVIFNKSIDSYQKQMKDAIRCLK